MYIDQTMFANLAKDKSLVGADYRIFFLLASKAEQFKDIRISQAEIGKELDMTQPNVNASIQRLVSGGVIVRDTTSHRHTYTIPHQYQTAPA